MISNPIYSFFAQFDTNSKEVCILKSHFLCNNFFNTRLYNNLYFRLSYHYFTGVFFSFELDTRTLHNKLFVYSAHYTMLDIFVESAKGARVGLNIFD